MLTAAISGMPGFNEGPENSPAKRSRSHPLGRLRRAASMKGRRILRPNRRAVTGARRMLSRFNEGPENSPAKLALVGSTSW